jgi:hypothetical protein
VKAAVDVQEENAAAQSFDEMMLAQRTNVPASRGALMILIAK